jgi:5'-3' exonuclease
MICTIDKDLDMIPGMHYNFVKIKCILCNQLTALKFFYKQMLIGDTSDHIFGIKGIGPVKAEKLLKDTKTEQEMFDIVYKLYNDPKRFVMNACCLWIQNKGELWVNRQNLILPEQCKQEVDLMLEFMMSLNLDI